MVDLDTRLPSVVRRARDPASECSKERSCPGLTAAWVWRLALADDAQRELAVAGVLPDQREPLRVWSFATLGKYFTFRVMISADQPVISNGPYRVLRHPGYAGAELAFIGVGLMYGNWVSVAALTLLPVIGIVNRIRVEEKALFNALGDTYRRYAATHKRLVPFIW